MNCLLILFITSISLNFYSDSTNCEALKSELQRLSFIASNLANVHTTHTPEGGFYHPYVIQSYTNATCKVNRDSKPILKYLPGHPDADKKGYVVFPNTNLNFEYLAFIKSAIKLKIFFKVRSLCS